MKVVILTQNLIPTFSGNGSSVFLWALLKGLKRQQFEVHLVTYNFSLEKWLKVTQSNSQSDLEEFLTNSGIIPHIIPYRENFEKIGFFNSYLGRTIWPKPEQYFQSFQYSEEISKILDQLKPDLVYPYMLDAIAGLNKYRATNLVQSIGLITDMDHLVKKYRRKYSTGNSIKANFFKLRNIIAERKHINTAINLLKGCDKICCSAYHHAEWLKQKGLRNIRYFPVPVLDRPGDQWANNKEKIRSKVPVPRIIMTGNINGIATLSGLIYFQNNLLEQFDSIYNQNKFELRIIGGGDLIDRMHNRFVQYPWIDLTGYVPRIEEEFYASTIVLVPTPIPLGFRTRIAEAFSYGSCVIAHKSNSLGMPELEHGKNVLLAGRPSEFGAAIRRCLTDTDFRVKLEKNARATYEEKYRGDMIVQNMIDYSLGN